MARGKTLLELLDDLRFEAGYTQKVAQQVQHRESQIIAIQKSQQWLWDDFDWPHLRVERFIPAAAGQRFYDPKDALDLDGNVVGDVRIDRIEELEFKWGGSYGRLIPGIGAPQYSLWDSDIDERSWPILRWQIFEDEQIEVWPIPSENANASDQEGYIKIIGIRNLKPLVEDDDVADLDDQLITLYAASELIIDENKANLKLSKANKRYAKIRGHLMPRKRRRMFLPGPDDEGRRPRGPVRVAYRTTNN